MLAEKIQLESDEEVLTQVRKHWFPVMLQMLAVVAFAFTPLIGFLVLLNIPVAFPFSIAEYTSTFVALYTGWLILSWMAFFGVWTNYYLDVWTITSKRLISVDQRGLFNRHTGSFRLERLQDINVSVRGILATFLGFGDLQAETASEDRDFVAKNIPDPQGLKSLILRATDTLTYSPKSETGGIDV